MSVCIIFYILSFVFQDFISEAYARGTDSTDHHTNTDGTVTMYLSPANTIKNVKTIYLYQYFVEM